MLENNLTYFGVFEVGYGFLYAGIMLIAQRVGNRGYSRSRWRRFRFRGRRFFRLCRGGMVLAHGFDFPRR